MASPYSDLDARAFWKTGVTERAALDPGDLYRAKFRLGARARVMTAGSCFAQHIGRALRLAGVDVIDAEPLPASVPDAVAEALGHRQFSARYGNIYTVQQLWQLLEEAEGLRQPADPVWQKRDRFYDAQRPSVEPEGYASPEEVLRHRAHHLGRVRAALRQADVMVFTFGLTEAWVDAASGTVYPTAPGTVAGAFDPGRHVFKNYDMIEVLTGFRQVRKLLHRINKRMRFVITVSPVPLTATASGAHVEVATAYSKAVLRAVCGKLQADFPDVDYFPSFEIITSINNRGVYYEMNKRSVTKEGVAQAMSMFLNAQGLAGQGFTAPLAGAKPDDADDVHCDDALLEAFAR